MSARHIEAKQRVHRQRGSLALALVLATALTALAGSATSASEATASAGFGHSDPAAPRHGTRALPGHADPHSLARPVSWQSALADSARSGEPIVVLFSTPGCAFCEFVRRDHLIHLARAEAPRGLQVFELSLVDRTPFPDDRAEASAQGPGADAQGAAETLPGRPMTFPASMPSPAAFAASLGIRFAPTVAFFGPNGEAAERLVGYPSADFYGAYLDERLATARKAIKGDPTR